MNRYFIFLPVFFLPVLLGLRPQNAVVENQPAFIKAMATPTPIAEIESVELDKSEAVYACNCYGYVPPSPTGCGLDENGKIKNDNFLIKVKTVVRNPKNTRLVYEYKVTGGRYFGQGDQIVWDLEGVRPGTYQITASIKGKGGVSVETRTQSVKLSECNCNCCGSCPMMEIKGKETVRASESLVFTANISGGTAYGYKYIWTVSQGEIVNGQGTPQIKVKTTRKMTGFIKATVKIEAMGLCEGCQSEETQTTVISK